MQLMKPKRPGIRIPIPSVLPRELIRNLFLRDLASSISTFPTVKAVLARRAVDGITSFSELVQDVEDHGAVAQGESTIEGPVSHLCTDKGVGQEIFDEVRGVGADHGVGLEEEDVFGWGELFP